MLKHMSAVCRETIALRDASGAAAAAPLARLGRQTRGRKRGDGGKKRQVTKQAFILLGLEVEWKEEKSTGSVASVVLAVRAVRH